MTKTYTSLPHTWTTLDGAVFPYSEWKAPGDPRAIVVAVHGLSGAGLDYEPLGRHLAGHGVTTIALELRGQGNDPVPERRGDLEQIEDWFADLQAFLSLMRREHPGLPFYFYGESMGAALLTRFVAQAAKEDQPAGLVLAAPVISFPKRPTWQHFLFRFFFWLRPMHRVDLRGLAQSKIDGPAKWLTRDEAHRTWLETAPHRLNRFTIRFFKCLLELISGCQEAAPQIQVPVLVVYAAHDIFIPPSEVESFFERLGSKDKQLEFFPHSYHLLLHDLDRESVLARVEGWILPRLDSL